MNMRASLEIFSHFHIKKTAISFNILLVLQILCRYKDMIPNVPIKLLKALLGGGGGGSAGYASVHQRTSELTLYVGV